MGFGLGFVWLFRECVIRISNLIVWNMGKRYNSLGSVQVYCIVLFDFFFSSCFICLVAERYRISNLNLGFLAVWSYEKLEFQVNCDKDKQLWLL